MKMLISNWKIFSQYNVKKIRKDIEDIRKELLILEKKINDRIIILENVIQDDYISSNEHNELSK